MRPASARRVRDGAGDIWRRVLPRVAADAMGLELAVSGFSERMLDIHGDLAVEEGALLVLLTEDGGPPNGLAVVDPALVTGLIEVQTTGRISSGRRDPRRPTAVDAALAGHAIDGWLTGVAEARGEARWSTGALMPDLRAALLKLEEGQWSETRVDLDLGGGRRTGRLRLYRPVPLAAKAGPAPPEAMQALLHPLETTLDAVLCRIRLPLGTVVSLAPGQVIPLPDVNLRCIRLEAPVGRLVAKVHLGQSRGCRAVRILPDGAQPSRPEARRLDPEPAPRHILPDLPDLPGLDGAVPGPPPLDLPGL